MFGFLKGHTCCTALIKITEWRAGLDDRKGIVAIVIDLSKAVDSISHSLVIAKLKAYGFVADAINVMKSVSLRLYADDTTEYYADH